MESYFNALRSAGIADSILLTVAIAILVIPIFWKLWKEAISLRLATRKDKLEGVFSVLESDGVSTHPLRVELVFRELFGVRMTFTEIEYLLNTESPLSSITDYKYGRRYILFSKDENLPSLSRTCRRLWWQEVLSTVSFIACAILLIGSLLFTMAAVLSGSSVSIVMTGVLTSSATVILAWFCLDEVRAVNAALRIAPVKNQGITIEVTGK